jgi:tetraacyldisaccharide 4'-kinase
MRSTTGKTHPRWLRFKSALAAHFYRQYYERPTWIYLLYPLSWLYLLLMCLRYFILRIEHRQSDALLIGVGNLTLGGGGKTPMVLWLARYAMNAGYRVAILSKGYQRQSSDPLLVVDATLDAQRVGDEPWLLWQQLGCPVIVCRHRKDGLAYAEQLGVDLIIADDGVQDVSIPFDCAILMVKSEVGFGNGMALPAGPLRQSRAAVHLHQLVVYTGHDVPQEPMVLAYALGPWVRLDGEPALPPAPGARVQAVCGIAHPKSFFAMLQTAGYVLTTHPYPDHHAFTEEDFAGFSAEDVIVMSEKDAVKCKGFADARFWVAPLRTEPSLALLAWVHHRLPIKPWQKSE